MMNAPHTEKKRVKITYGSSFSNSKLVSLAACHPFSEQLDVVFPCASPGSEGPLTAALRALETSYGKARCTLENVLHQAGNGRFVNSYGESDLLVVSSGSNSPDDDDVWCIDSRAHLTLSVSKEAYEKLGLVGQKLPFGKSSSDCHVIDIPLQKNAQPVKLEARQKGSLKAWDKRRKETGVGEKAGLWDVLYTSNSTDNSSELQQLVDALFQEPKTIRVQCKKREMKDVHVPVPSLSSQPNPKPSVRKRKADEVDSQNADSKDEEDAQVQKDRMDDWNAHIASLFEWVGMACLGAQRLQIYDRVDPYVALYEPPQPTDSTTNCVTHLQWCGLLSPKFVKEVMNVVLTNLQNPTSTTSFVSMTCHAYTRSPVSYIPYTTDKNGGTSLQNPERGVPKKLPRADGEDTWSVIVEKAVEGVKSKGTLDSETEVPKVRWCLAESLGQWDTR